MKVNLINQPFLIYSGNLLAFLFNDKENMKNFRTLSNKSWGTAVISVGRIVYAVNTTPDRAISVMEYEVEP